MHRQGFVAIGNVGYVGAYLGVVQGDGIADRGAAGGTQVDCFNIGNTGGQRGEAQFSRLDHEAVGARRTVDAAIGRIDDEHVITIATQQRIRIAATI